jgi:hypothetical protein
MLVKIKRLASRYLKSVKKKYKSNNKTKYFCIGQNKTGTTSLERAFEDLGYPVGDQRKAEVLTGKHYFEGDFQPIIDYCRSAQVFQDVPFSYPETYKVLDEAYPGSKFILTVRDDAQQWYRSITRFHAKLFGKDGRVPTIEDLSCARLVWPGFMAHIIIGLYGTPESDPYNKEILTAHYEKYNREVLEYFKNRPYDLLVINVGGKGAYQKFVQFIGVNSPFDDFPWENRT